MTYTEILKNIKRLTVSEQRAIYNELQRTLRAEPEKAKRKHTLKSMYGVLRVREIADPNETPEQRAKRLASLPTAEEMTGVIPAGGHVPSDDELKEDYVNYLVEKYK
jgi:hypothetical protein